MLIPPFFDDEDNDDDDNNQWKHKKKELRDTMISIIHRRLIFSSCHISKLRKILISLNNFNFDVARGIMSMKEKLPLTMDNFSIGAKKFLIMPSGRDGI